ncbi:MAG: membrane protein insertion efficiency factor YidD [bacterium]|nr:membrane protein insertion efficiency factor YidD [bacterium]
MVKKVFLGLINIYRHFFSPLFPPTCRFFPTCSQYAYDAISMYGPWKGLWKSIRRILRCHPFHPGGYDPIE